MKTATLKPMAADHTERRSARAEAASHLGAVVTSAYDRARALYQPDHPREWAALTARYLPNLAGAERLEALDALAATHDQRFVTDATSRSVELDGGWIVSDERAP